MQHTDGDLAGRLAELEQDPEYVADTLALDVIEQVLALMEEQHLSRASLAAQMGVSRAYVTRVFDAPPNLTLHSIARLALALGARPAVTFVSRSTPTVLTWPNASWKGEQFASEHASRVVAVGKNSASGVAPVADSGEPLQPAA